MLGFIATTTASAAIAELEYRRYCKENNIEPIRLSPPEIKAQEDEINPVYLLAAFCFGLAL